MRITPSPSGSAAQMDRNFVCDRCEGTFGRKDFLLHHRKLHEKASRILCPWCPKTFREKRKSDLTRHIKRVHMDSSSPRLPAGGGYECVTPPTPTVDEEAVMYTTDLGKNNMAFGESGSPARDGSCTYFPAITGTEIGTKSTTWPDDNQRRYSGRSARGGRD